MLGLCVGRMFGLAAKLDALKELAEGYPAFHVHIHNNRSSTSK